MKEVPKEGINDLTAEMKQVVGVILTEEKRNNALFIIILRRINYSCFSEPATWRKKVQLLYIIGRFVKYVVTYSLTIKFLEAI